jgi:hypothetical protein
MNQQRLKAYLNLIQGLLTCPSGEEWILLRQNEELVNSELVQVMEQVASHLAEEGNIKAAKFLHNLAGQLHHILTDSIKPPKHDDQLQAYVELIQALLNCPEGSESEILAANQELIGPGLVQAMKQVANKMKAEGDLETASFLTDLAAELNRTWLQTHEFKPTLKKDDKESGVSPDPWEEAQKQQPQPTETKTTPTDLTPEVTTKGASSVQPDVEINQEIAKNLAVIAESLSKLETILNARLQPSDPLWYMNVLEKAETCGWILTTEEVEQLIGVKPRCHEEENFYQRGCWTFIKAGKIGLQTAWRVKKESTNSSLS